VIGGQEVDFMKLAVEVPFHYNAYHMA